jgi:predicted nuclease of predicted toxin-antitoxin system
MKLLIDNNLSYKLADYLKAESMESVHIKNALTVLSFDTEIWDYARENDLVILTKDNDFDELSQLYGCPPKVIHVLCGNKSTVYIFDLIVSYKFEINQFINTDSENCLLKISD